MEQRGADEAARPEDVISNSTQGVFITRTVLCGKGELQLNYSKILGLAQEGSWE